jgi:hypothetical protein
MERPDPVLIPPPSAVREHLARNLRENRLLRSLLKVSERAAEERRREQPRGSRTAADGRGVDQ